MDGKANQKKQRMLKKQDVGGVYGMQGGIKKVFKLKEENQNKSSSLGHQRHTFELNEDNPIKKLYLIHQVQFPDFWLCSDYLFLKFFLVKDCLVMPNIQPKNYQNFQKRKM